jgi:hypothetical protein
VVVVVFVVTVVAIAVETATAAATNTANGTGQLGPSFVANELTIGKMESHDIDAMTGRDRSYLY